MADIKSKLQKLMDENGIASVTELSRQSNVPQPTLHKILKGDTLNPRQSVLDRISSYFQVPPSYFMSRVTGEHSSGDYAVSIKTLRGGKLYDTGEVMTVNNLQKKVDFVVSMGDNKFFPIFQSGSYLFITEDHSYLTLSGIYFICEEKGRSDIYITYYDEGTLLASNVIAPTKPPIIVTAELRKKILGIILESRSYLAQQSQIE